jgi:hypothetical protein
MKILITFILTVLASIGFGLQNSEYKIPNLYFDVGLTNANDSTWVHVVQFSSYEGQCSIIEVTVSPLLFYIDHRSTTDGTIRVSRIAKGEFKVEYQGMDYESNASSKWFIFNYDLDNQRLLDIRGTATSINERGNVYTDVFLPIRDETHFRTMRLITPIPGIYPSRH